MEIKIQGTPDVILTCADCGEEGPIGGTRGHGDGDQPHDPLCPECFALAVRFAGETERLRLHVLGPASDTDEDGTVWLRRKCPRCGGAGRIQHFAGVCFRCLGWRWDYVSPKNVQRTARWSATFQANRIPERQR